MAIDKFEGDYRFLSNFWEVPVVYDGVEWPTAEHAYQAAKFSDPKKKLKIRQSPTATDAKRLGRAKTGFRLDWDKVKFNIMKAIVTAKFEQHHMLLEKLKQTGNEELIEGNWWGDTYWGICKGKGENHLGKILMEIRG